MLKLDQSSGRLLPVPRLRLRSQDPGREYDLARIIRGSPAEFFSEIDETVFVIGANVAPRSDLPPAGAPGTRIDLLALDLNGRPVAVIVHESKASSCFARSLLCSEWLATWRPEDFLRNLSPGELERLRQFLRAELHAINREQRVILVGEQHNHEVLWAARSLRTKCGVDITLIRAAVAVDPASGAEYLSLRREFPAIAAAWDTLVEQNHKAAKVDVESVFSDTPGAAAVEPEVSAAPPSAPVVSPDPAKDPATAASPGAQPERNEALRTLAAGFAEFLNDTEAAIAGSADLAAREAPRDFVARQRFEAISRVAERLSRMSEQLLVYAGRGMRNVAGFDAARLLEHSIESAGCLLLPNVELRTEITNELGELEGDSTQIAQVISHLLNNAVEALPESGGRITLRAGRLAAAPEMSGAYHGADLREGEYFCVEVSDTGYGMDEELTSRIFDPFFSTKAPGRGLGLMAVLGIVQNHEGGVQVESTPGKGSTFRVLLPVPRAAASRDLGSPAPASSGIGSGRSVLVIGDQESFRSVARQTFEAEGFRVLTTADGWEALEIFAHSAEQIDAVVLDWMLSNMDAEEAFRAVRRIRNDTRVILCGGFSEEEASRRIGGKKFAGYLRKPFQPESLKELLTQLLEEQPAPSQAKAS